MKNDDLLAEIKRRSMGAGMFPEEKKPLYNEFDKPPPSPWTWENFAYGAIIGIVLLLILASVPN